MVARKPLVVFIVLGVLATHSAVSSGQDSETLKTDHFQISTSVALSFRGLVMSTQYKLVDELGFEYDVISLLRNQSVKEMAGVDELQFEELFDAWWGETKEMRGRVVSG